MIMTIDRALAVQKPMDKVNLGGIEISLLGRPAPEDQP
jgi:hypothetical protein